MKSLLDLFSVFGILMFMLMIYLLSKIIIEKNAQSISMTKVLGYSNGEISRIYIMSTSIVVIGAIVATIPVVNFVMRYIFRIILIDFSGWLPYNVPFSALAKMGVMGIISYAVIIYVQYRKVRRIPLDMALKNVE